MDLSNSKQHCAHIEGERSYKLFEYDKSLIAVFKGDKHQEPKIVVINKGIAHTKPTGVLGSGKKRTISFYLKMFSGGDIKKVIFCDSGRIYAVPLEQLMAHHLTNKVEGIGKKIYIRLEDLAEYIL